MASPEGLGVHFKAKAHAEQIPLYRKCSDLPPSFDSSSLWHKDDYASNSAEDTNQGRRRGSMIPFIFFFMLDSRIHDFVYPSMTTDKGIITRFVQHPNIHDTH
jgi:hypothetical protein